MHKYNLLLVDDEPRVTSALRAIFRRDYTVLVANSGMQALKLFTHNKIDIILCDQRMPGMLGNELLSKISNRYPQTMRILLTGFMDKEAIVDSINQGEIYRFINKPWDNNKLRKVVAEAAVASQTEIEPQTEGTPHTDNVKSKFGDQHGQVNNAILMIEQNPNVRNQIRKFCREMNIMIYGTQNIDQAITAVTSRENIGVAVIELSAEPEEALKAIGLLKQNRPELITIALADEFDTNTAISLINQGQAFRYLTTPLNLEHFQISVQHAFRRNKFLKKNLNSNQRFQVEQTKGDVINSLQSLFNKLVKPATSH